MSKKKENVKKKDDKKNNNKKFKNAFSWAIGPRLETWLVWITMFGLGVAFLAFGDVVFYEKVRKEKIDSVPVWTQVVTETLTYDIKSDSNNLHDTGGFLNYSDDLRNLSGDALKNYNQEGNYYGDVPFDTTTSAALRVYMLYDSNYFRDFLPEGYSLDRFNTYFRYIVEMGSNISVTSVSIYRSSLSNPPDLTPNILHEISYSEIGYTTTFKSSYFTVNYQKIDPFNYDVDANTFRIYPAVEVRFYSFFDTYAVKSYNTFKVDKKITRKTEMVMHYEEKVTYYDEYEFSLSQSQFNEVATGLFKNVTEYVGKFLDIFNTIFGFLQNIFDFIVGSFLNIINYIVALFS